MTEGEIKLLQRRYNYSEAPRWLTEITEPMMTILLRVKLHVFLSMTLHGDVWSASLFTMKVPTEFEARWYSSRYERGEEDNILYP
jgi:hypothetical protein